MRKYTQKELRHMVSDGFAEDITRYSFDDMDAFLKNHTLEKVGYSRGVYGINGGLLQDTKNGTFYAIVSRNTALFMAF